MVDLTILAMTEDEGWLASFWSEARRLKKTRVVATRSMDEADDLLDLAGTRLLVLDCRSGSFTLDDLDRLLWANSTRAHPARVLVIDQTIVPNSPSTFSGWGSTNMFARLITVFGCRRS